MVTLDACREKSPASDTTKDSMDCSGSKPQKPATVSKSCRETSSTPNSTPGFADRSRVVQGGSID